MSRRIVWQGQVLLVIGFGRRDVLSSLSVVSGDERQLGCPVEVKIQGADIKQKELQVAISADKETQIGSAKYEIKINRWSPELASICTRGTLQLRYNSIQHTHARDRNLTSMTRLCDVVPILPSLARLVRELLLLVASVLKG